MLDFKMGEESVESPFDFTFLKPCVYGTYTWAGQQQNIMGFHPFPKM